MKLLMQYSRGLTKPLSIWSCERTGSSLTVSGACRQMPSSQRPIIEHVVSPGRHSIEDTTRNTTSSIQLCFSGHSIGGLKLD